MFVGICKVTLMVDGAQSLKDKRMVLRRIKDRTSNAFNVAIAEVGDQDLWQSAELGLAVVANDRRFVQEMLDKILNFIENLAVARIIDDEKEILSYADD